MVTKTDLSRWRLTPFLMAFIFCFALVWLAGAEASAAEPEQQVKVSVDKVLNTLRNKELKKPDKTKERRALIRKAVNERFDFAEMAKRSLATHWRTRTPEERKEFIPLFTDLLERSYINKIESYQNERIVYSGEEVTEQYAVVKSKIITKRNVEVPIDYRLLQEEGDWKVYDVIIEGVSLVNNYRVQFNNIIRKDSFAELVKRMKNKQEEESFGEKK